VLEKAVIGGLAAITASVENYPGFDKGVGGLELADHLADHAKRFGAQILTGIDVQGLQRSGELARVQTKQGEYHGRTVLIATGSTYKHLDVPGESDLIGHGLHFCATCDGPLYRGKELVVIGGGNSAMQETLFLAKFAGHITILARDGELKGTAILRKQVQALTNVTIIYNTTVLALNRTQDHIIVEAGDGTHPEEPVRYATDGVFVFVGLQANTEPFAGLLDLDAQGFIITQPDYSTSLPAVYAAGDVRSGSTWQIASAVGEGANAALAVRAYLDARKRV
jgi:thioredoxin reductase (NADPH)